MAAEREVGSNKIVLLIISANDNSDAGPSSSKYTTNNTIMENNKKNKNLANQIQKKPDVQAPTQLRETHTIKW